MLYTPFLHESLQLFSYWSVLEIFYTEQNIILCPFKSPWLLARQMRLHNLLAHNLLTLAYMNMYMKHKVSLAMHYGVIFTSRCSLACRTARVSYKIYDIWPVGYQNKFWVARAQMVCTGRVDCPGFCSLPHCHVPRQCFSPP